MIKLTEEQKDFVTKNSELFLQVYEEAKRAAINYGLPREEWQSFTMVFVLVDFLTNSVTTILSRQIEAKMKELKDLAESLEKALKKISEGE